MKDWFFYPLIALIIAAMIGFSLKGIGEKEPVNPEDGFVLQGPELQYLTAAPGTTLSFDENFTYAIMGADFKANVDPSAGVFALLNKTYSEAYAGRDLVMTIRARAARTNSSDEFMIAFLPYTSGKVKWQTFEPGPEFQDYVLTTTLGPFNKEKPDIFFGIWPDKDGRGGQIEVEKYEVRLAE